MLEIRRSAAVSISQGEENGRARLPRGVDPTGARLAIGLGRSSAPNEYLLRRSRPEAGVSPCARPPTSAVPSLHAGGIQAGANRQEPRP